jgi:hypothetical protein
MTTSRLTFAVHYTMTEYECVKGLTQTGVFQNTVPRRKFGSKEKKVTGE